QYIGVAGVSNPVMVFALCAVFGVALFLAGYGCWQLLVLLIVAAIAIFFLIMSCALFVSHRRKK
ncbi:hypothetical protein H6B10_17515, partial [Gemmiger formicilis]|nr:hypothetical protein [Gemmiger formicilis]